MDISPADAPVGVSLAVGLHVGLTAARLFPQPVEKFLAVNSKDKVLVPLAVAVYQKSVARNFDVAIWDPKFVLRGLPVDRKVYADHHGLETIAKLVVYRHR